MTKFLKLKKVNILLILFNLNNNQFNLEAEQSLFTL